MFEEIKSIIKILLIPYGWLKNYQQAMQSQQQLKLTAYQTRINALADESANLTSWEIAELVHADKWLQIASFVMLNLPFLVAWIKPELAIHYFTTIGGAPKFWLNLYMGMNGAIFGFSVLKNPILNALKK